MLRMNERMYRMIMCVILIVSIQHQVHWDQLIWSFCLITSFRSSHFSAGFIISWISSHSNTSSLLINKIILETVGLYINVCLAFNIKEFQNFAGTCTEIHIVFVINDQHQNFLSCVAKHSTLISGHDVMFLMRWDLQQKGE